MAVSVLRGSMTTISGLVLVAEDPLPKDRVRNAEVGSDQHDHVGFFEIGVGIGRGVEAERLFVGGDGGGHALAGIAVAMDHPHAELCRVRRGRPVPHW